MRTGERWWWAGRAGERWSRTQIIWELGKKPREKRLNHRTRISWSSGRMTKSVSSPRKTAELILIWSDEGFRVDALNLSCLWEFQANSFCLYLSHKGRTKWAFLLLLVPVQSIPKGWKCIQDWSHFLYSYKSDYTGVIYFIQCGYSTVCFYSQRYAKHFSAWLFLPIHLSLPILVLGIRILLGKSH